MTWCPDHDPLTRAGFISCGTCGRRSWPVDATWTDQRLILATYSSGCRHVAEVTFLVDPDQLDRDTRWCGELATTTGEPCRNRAGPDGGPCRVHTKRGVR